MMSLLKYVDPVVGSAAGAILFTTLTQYYPARRLELCSEIVCWAVLPIIFKHFPLSGSHPTLPVGHSYEPKKQDNITDHAKISQWLVAAGIAAAAFYRAESNIVGFYVRLFSSCITFTNLDAACSNASVNRSTRILLISHKML